MESILLGARWGQQRVARIKIPCRVREHHGKSAAIPSGEEIGKGIKWSCSQLRIHGLDRGSWLRGIGARAI